MESKAVKSLINWISGLELVPHEVVAAATDPELLLLLNVNVGKPLEAREVIKTYLRVLVRRRKGYAGQTFRPVGSNRKSTTPIGRMITSTMLDFEDTMTTVAVKTFIANITDDFVVSDGGWQDDQHDMDIMDDAIGSGGRLVQGDSSGYAERIAARAIKDAEPAVKPIDILAQATWNIETTRDILFQLTNAEATTQEVVAYALTGEQPDSNFKMTTVDFNGLSDFSSLQGALHSMVAQAFTEIGELLAQFALMSALNQRLMIGAGPSRPLPPVKQYVAQRNAMEVASDAAAVALLAKHSDRLGISGDDSQAALPVASGSYRTADLLQLAKDQAVRERNQRIMASFRSR